MNEIKEIKGKIHSQQSLGTVDGPGIRYVVFMQGCPLRCNCCHNPDTWSKQGGTEWTVPELMARVIRCRNYFGFKGGITVSGGEPLLQSEFVRELFLAAKAEGINTCLDTSGCILDLNAKRLLRECDRVLLDIKWTNEEDYKRNVGCSLSTVLKFLDHLNEKKIPTTIRQVIIPTKNDTEENINALAEIVNAHPSVDKVELLPFKKLCQTKYDDMGLVFPLADIPSASHFEVDELKKLLNSKLLIENY